MFRCDTENEITLAVCTTKEEALEMCQKLRDTYSKKHEPCPCPACPIKHVPRSVTTFAVVKFTSGKIVRAGLNNLCELAWEPNDGLATSEVFTVFD